MYYDRPRRVWLTTLFPERLWQVEGEFKALPPPASQLHSRWLCRSSLRENLQQGRHRGLPVPIRFCAPRDHSRSLSPEEEIQTTRCRLHDDLPTIWACTTSWTSTSCSKRRWFFRLYLQVVEGPLPNQNREISSSSVIPVVGTYVSV